MFLQSGYIEKIQKILIAWKVVFPSSFFHQNGWIRRKNAYIVGSKASNAIYYPKTHIIQQIDPSIVQTYRYHTT